MQLAGYRDLDQCNALYTDTTDPPTAPYFAYEHYKKINANDTCYVRRRGSAISGVAVLHGHPLSGAVPERAVLRRPGAQLPLRHDGRNERAPRSVDHQDVHRRAWTTRTRSTSRRTPSPRTSSTSTSASGPSTGSRTCRRTARRPQSASATPTSGNAPLAVQLNGSASVDPDGDPLTYSWDTDGNGPSATPPARTDRHLRERRDVPGPAAGLRHGRPDGDERAGHDHGDDGLRTGEQEPTDHHRHPRRRRHARRRRRACGTAPAVVYTRQWQRCTTTTDHRLRRDHRWPTHLRPTGAWVRPPERPRPTCPATTGPAPTSAASRSTRRARSPATPTAAVTLDGNDDTGRQLPGSRDLRQRARASDLWVKSTNTSKEGDARLLRGGRADRGVPAARPARHGRLREGCARLHRRVGERRPVAPPRGHLDVDRGRAACLQGRRPRCTPARSRRVHRSPRAARSSSARTRTR